MDTQKLALIPLWLIPFIFSLCFHEFSHAWMANRLGDSTAKFMGRLSMNPMVHVDPIGTIFFPILGFLTGFPLIGWAKPVMINERNLKRPAQDGMFVAAAGPLSNLFLAFGFTGLAFMVNRWGPSWGELNKPVMMMIVFGIQLNVFLAFFNLIPMPPLDGGRVLRGLVPSLTPALDSLERYGFIILLVLLYTGLIKILLTPAFLLINELMSWI